MSNVVWSVSHWMKKKTELLWHLGNFSALSETENKIICQISGLKSGRTREYLTEKQNGYLRSGRLREVVAMRELTVFLKLYMYSVTFSCPILAILIPFMIIWPFFQGDDVFLPVTTRKRIMKFWHVSHSHARPVKLLLRVVHDILINKMV